MGVKKDVDELCPDATHCSPAGVRLEDTGRMLGTVSTVSLIAGAAGTGVGVFLLLWRGGEGSSQPAAEVGPAAVGSGAGFGMRGRF